MGKTEYKQKNMESKNSAQIERGNREIMHVRPATNFHFNVFRRKNEPIIKYLNRKYDVEDFLDHLSEILREVMTHYPFVPPHDYANLFCNRFGYNEQNFFVNDLLEYLQGAVRIKSLQHKVSKTKLVDHSEIIRIDLPKLTEFMSISIYCKLKRYSKFSSMEELDVQEPKIRNSYQSVGIVRYKYALNQKYWFPGNIITGREYTSAKGGIGAFLDFKDPLGEPLSIFVLPAVYHNRKELIHDSYGSKARVFGKVIWDYRKKRNMLELEEIVKQPKPVVQVKTGAFAKYKNNK